MDIDMVYISLRTVEKNTPGVIKCFFHSSTQKARPICRNQITTNRIRMVTEINQDKRVTAFLVKSQNINSLIYFSNGM